MVVIESLRYGDVVDFVNFGGVVIDCPVFDWLIEVQQRMHTDFDVCVIVGGKSDDSEGFFVLSTIAECTDFGYDVFCMEYFGLLLLVYVYDDAEWDVMLI